MTDSPQQNIHRQPSRPRSGLLRRASVALLTVGLVAGLAACAPADAAGEQASGGKDGGEITVLTNNFAAGWVSSKSSTNLYEAQVWGQITDKLLDVDNDGNISPWIAKSWETSEDGLTYTLHLTEGATFSDGTPLDAAAVVANLEIWGKGDTDRGIVRLGLFPQSYVSSEAVDESTVQITLSRADLSFLPSLGYHGAILLSPATLALDLDEQADLLKDVGSGPFVVESYVPEEEVVLVRRDDYDWASEGAKHSGAAYLDRITFRVVPEDVLRASSVESGQAQIAQNVPPTELASLKETGFEVFTPRYFGSVHGLQLRPSAKFLDDVKVRQAVQYGIDRDEILDTVYTEDWLPAEGPFNSNVPEAVDLSELFAFDPKRSEQLLDEAGWTEVGDDGIRVKDGERLSFNAVPSPFVSTSQAEWELIAQQLAKIGIEIKLQNADVATYWATYTVDASLPFFESNMSFVDVSSARTWWRSDLQNLFHADDPELDAKLDALADSADAEARPALAEDVQRYVLEQAYYVPLEQLSQGTYLQSPTVKDVSFNIVARPSYYDTWVDESAK